jgi:hypothetical protein
MNSLNTFALKCNKKIKFNFDGGDLSSDAGLLLIKEFASKTGLEDLVKSYFQTKDDASFRHHSDQENLMQVIYQLISAYFQDDCADELTNDPIMTTILEKEALASQPTLSRFFQRMDEDTLAQTNQILREMRKRLCPRPPESMSLDLDTTLFGTYGHQEGSAFNNHYRQVGYHPILCFDTDTRELLKAELRNGAQYCSNGSGQFMADLLDELREDYSGTLFCLRADSGFASPELYDVLEEKGCKYAIRLKENSKLHELVAEADAALYERTGWAKDALSYAHTCGEFMYQAGSWSHPRRVIFKIEKPEGQFHHVYTFIVTTMDGLDVYEVLQYYCGRGRMENYIQECKSGFGFTAVSSSSMKVNANRLQVHCLAYNLFNWFRNLVLPEKMRKHHIDTFRIKLLKIAARMVRSARYITFKLCSSCPYKQEFTETLKNIWNLQICME